MAMVDTLGVPAHRGGLVVERPELTIGVVNAICRPTGLELELLARRPLDRRHPAQRQDDIRAGRAGPAIAARRLLPAFDEGLDLRAGWLDGDGRARWEFASSWSSSSGDHFEGVNGPSLRTVFDFPPLFDRMSVVLAWPEIGFPETVLDLPLPDRATVERDTVSIWAAPAAGRPAPRSPAHRAGPFPAQEAAVETGRLAAKPRVLSRGPDAVVVLTRLTTVGETLSMEILSVARNGRVRAGNGPRRAGDDGRGAAVAVWDGGGDALRLPSAGGTAGGGGPDFRSTSEFTASRPAGGNLRLLVGWPAAGLHDVSAEVALLG